MFASEHFVDPKALYDFIFLNLFDQDSSSQVFTYAAASRPNDQCKTMYIQGQTRKGEMYSRYNKSRTDTDQHADKELYSNTSKFYIDSLKLIIHLSFISRFRKKNIGQSCRVAVKSCVFRF